MEAINDGGPAFPSTILDDALHVPGMSLRAYFAGHVQADDRLVKCVRAMDDSALEFFALHPGAEREEHITEVDMEALHLTNWHALPSEVAKVTRRLELEAHAIARVRAMQADALIAALAKEAGNV